MLASLSLDLDNKWSYLKTHGDPGWDAFPTYLPVLVPRVLELLDDLDLKITFFVVGQDAARQENHAPLRAIAEAGHEIGNHSFHHEPWLHLYSQSQLDEEFDRSEEAIRACTGATTVGFRGPGFSYSQAVLETLASRGYRYDASTFPTFLGPVARAYYFFNSSLTAADRDKRRQLFGTFDQGFQRLRPYRLRLNAGDLIEIPVTTMPWSKVPIHLSYVMYLACYSPWVAKAYFKQALRFCWINGVEPSLLLHPLDFFGQDDDADLAFFPGMSMARRPKLALARDLLGWMAGAFRCVPMLQHVEAVEERLGAPLPKTVAV